MEDNRKNPEYEEHNATLDPDTPVEVSDDELQDSILEDSGMNGFQRFIAKMDDARWTLVQRVVGALMGLGAGIALFWESGSTEQRGMFSPSLIIALGIALILPNVIEKQGQRKVPKLRVAMVIALLIVLVAFFLITGLKNGFSFTKA